MQLSSKPVAIGELRRCDTGRHSTRALVLKHCGVFASDWGLGERIAAWNTVEEAGK